MLLYLNTTEMLYKAGQEAGPFLWITMIFPPNCCRMIFWQTFNMRIENFLKGDYFGFVVLLPRIILRRWLPAPFPICNKNGLFFVASSLHLVIYLICLGLLVFPHSYTYFVQIWQRFCLLFSLFKVWNLNSFRPSPTCRTRCILISAALGRIRPLILSYTYSYIMQPATKDIWLYANKVN